MLLLIDKPEFRNFASPYLIQPVIATQDHIWQGKFAKAQYEFDAR